MGTLGPKDRSSRPEAGVGFLGRRPGRGSESPSNQLEGLGERCKLPQRGPGRGKFRLLSVHKYASRTAESSSLFSRVSMIMLILACMVCVYR